MGQKELKLALVDLAGEEIHLATTALPGNSQLVECSRFEELPSDVELIICVVGSTEDMCLQGSKKIISESSLHDKPLVIVGHQVAELERVFGRYFEFFETVSQPFEQNEIRFAIERLRARYLRRKKLTTITDQSTPFSAESSQDDLRVGLTLELALEIDEFSSESQAALNKLEKATQWIGGEHYHDEIEAEKLVSLPLFPQSPLLQKSLCEVAAEAPEAARQRLLRGCFLLASASDLLHLPEERKEAILSTRVKIAACLEGSSISQTLSGNFLLQEKSLSRKRYAGRLKDLALDALQSGENRAVGECLRQYSLALEDCYEASKNSNLEAGMVLFVSELIESVCYGEGHYDPAAAYHLFRKFKNGLLADVSPEVWAFGLRFLSEVVASRTNVVQLPKALRKNPEALEQLLKEHERPLKDGETRVAITELMGGMTLSQPLTAVDGRQILQPGVKLDDDLVWRIVQLSAIRPLYPAIVLS